MVNIIYVNVIPFHLFCNFRFKCNIIWHNLQYWHKAQQLGPRMPHKSCKLWQFLVIRQYFLSSSLLKPPSLAFSSLLKLFISLKNIPTCLHHRKWTTAVPLTPLPKSAQNLMLMHCSYHVSYTPVWTLPLPDQCLCTSPTDKMQPDTSLSSGCSLTTSSDICVDILGNCHTQSK
jgi:hypothetical protein